MLKRSVFALVAVLALSLAAGVTFADDSYTGEVVEKACFVSRGAHGPDHVACAESCFSRGGDVGLLMADGTLLILRAGDDAAPLEALKGMAGKQATISGTMADEKDGDYDVVTVTASEAGN